MSDGAIPVHNILTAGQRRHDKGPETSAVSQGDRRTSGETLMIIPPAVSEAFMMGEVQADDLGAVIEVNSCDQLMHRDAPE